jgi:hypothetical protein
MRRGNRFSRRISISLRCLRESLLKLRTGSEKTRHFKTKKMKRIALLNLHLRFGTVCCDNWRGSCAALIKSVFVCVSSVALILVIRSSPAGASVLAEEQPVQLG